MRSSSPAFCLLTLVSLASSANAQAGKHLESAAGWNAAPVSDSMMSTRLRHAAQDYRQYAPIPRIALYDLGYPSSAQEYSALGGNAVLLVTAVVRDSSELPATHVYVREGAAGDRELHRLGVACGRVATAEVAVATTFGKYRCDALYVLPLVLRAGTGELLVDFAAHRQGFRLVQFDGQLPQYLRDLRVPASPSVPDTAFATFLAREYPGLADRILRQ